MGCDTYQKRMLALKESNLFLRQDVHPHRGRVLSDDIPDRGAERRGHVFCHTPGRGARYGGYDEIAPDLGLRHFPLVLASDTVTVGDVMSSTLLMCILNHQCIEGGLTGIRVERRDFEELCPGILERVAFPVCRAYRRHLVSIAVAGVAAERMSAR
jgi:hypothetical protein